MPVPKEHEGGSVTPTALSLSTGFFSKLQRLGYFTGFALTSTLSLLNGPSGWNFPP